MLTTSHPRRVLAFPIDGIGPSPGAVKESFFQPGLSRKKTDAPRQMLAASLWQWNGRPEWVEQDMALLSRGREINLVARPDQTKEGSHLLVLPSELGQASGWSMAYLTNGKMVRNIAHVAPEGTHLAVTFCFVLGAVPFSPIAGAGLHKAASGGGKASAAG
ncbi:MAG: hypothetical protein Q9215_000700 [Flavoplaca cf. flavocitrina]